MSRPGDAQQRTHLSTSVFYKSTDVQKNSPIYISTKSKSQSKSLQKSDMFSIVHFLLFGALKEKKNSPQCYLANPNPNFLHHLTAGNVCSRAVAGRFYPAPLQAPPKPTAITTPPQLQPLAPLGAIASVCDIGLIITALGARLAVAVLKSIFSILVIV